MIGPVELILILALLLLLFGATRIPKIARSLGIGIKEFKKGLKEKDQKDKKDTDE
jgi:sec-independent protein translocase protein TatA